MGRKTKPKSQKRKRETPLSVQPVIESPSLDKPFLVVLALFLAVGFGGYFFFTRYSPPSTFAELIALSPQELEKCDVALMNLLCAEGLNGSENMNISDCMEFLDEITEKVKTATKKQEHQFQKDPAYFDHSESVYKMMAMITAVSREMGIKYDVEATSLSDDEFFEDSRRNFLHGVLSKNYKKGACSSIPTLYYVIGKRLCYPLHMVPVKKHTILRWEDGKERFNIECTNGFGSKPDEHYYKEPFPMSEKEIKEGFYLRNLDKHEILLDFMVNRMACLDSEKRYKEAIEVGSHVFDATPETYSKYKDSLAYFLQQIDKKHNEPLEIIATNLKFQNDLFGYLDARSEQEERKRAEKERNEKLNTPSGNYR